MGRFLLSVLALPYLICPYLFQISKQHSCLRIHMAVCMTSMVASSWEQVARVHSHDLFNLLFVHYLCPNQHTAMSEREFLNWILQIFPKINIVVDIYHPMLFSVLFLRYNDIEYCQCALIFDASCSSGSYKLRGQRHGECSEGELKEEVTFSGSPEYGVREGAQIRSPWLDQEIPF